MKSVKLQSCWVRMGLTPVTGVLVRRGPEGLQGRKTCTCVSQLLQAPPGHALLVGGWPRHTVTTPPLGDPGAGPSSALREKHTEPKGHFTRIPGTGLPLTSQPRDPGEQGTEQCGWGAPGVGTALPGPHRARFPAPSETRTLTPGPVLQTRNRAPQRSFRTDDGYTPRHHNYGEGLLNDYSGPGTRFDTCINLQKAP